MGDAKDTVGEGAEDDPWVRWFEYLGGSKADSTVSDYKPWAMRFQEWLEMEGREPGKSAWADFDALLRDGSKVRAVMGASGTEEPWDVFEPWTRANPPTDGYSRSTRVQALSAVKSWLEFHHDVEFPDDDPTNKVHNVVEGENPPFDPVIAEPDEISRILEETEECDADACGTMARVGYDALMRSIEVTRARWEDVDLKRGTIFVRTAQGGEPRRVRLDDRTVEAMTDYTNLVEIMFEDPQHLFYTFYPQVYRKPWTRGGWSDHFSDKHWEAGFYSFARHSAIVNRLNAGEAPSDVARRAGYKRPASIQRYLELVDA